MVHLNGKQGIVDTCKSVLLTSPSMNPCLSTMTDDDKRNAIWYNVFLETDKYIEFPSTYLRPMFCVDHGRHDNNILAMLRANPVANVTSTSSTSLSSSSSSLRDAQNHAKQSDASETQLQLDVQYKEDLEQRLRVAEDNCATFTRDLQETNMELGALKQHLDEAEQIELQNEELQENLKAIQSAMIQKDEMVRFNTKF